eukprot:TRINITY_DN14910_c0_g1_i1.p1 TRINITY_DN14910_c0_g1~~TRINITY_DN14910_c0_g1_i1.p1  ORF type:complete len:646 (-),score=126.93 TRINITY_DN14910_c0_g1_i1:101-2038(-)
MLGVAAWALCGIIFHSNVNAVSGLELKHQALRSSQHRDAARSTRATAAQPQLVGDGPGRGLYQVNTVELPENATGKQCLTIRMDSFTHSMTVDSSAGPDANSLAWGCFNDSISDSGWASLEVTTTEDTSSPLQTRAYAAGMVEGLLTVDRTIQFVQNVEALMAKDTGGGAVKQVVDKAIRMSLVAWQELGGGAESVTEPKDDIARQAWALMLQLRGIRDGVNFAIEYRKTNSNAQAAMPQKISMYQLMLANMHAEIPAIVEMYGRSEQVNILTALLQTSVRNGKHASGPRRAVRKEPWPRWASHQPHGSAIVRRVGPVSEPDIVAGHVSFGEYGEMLRIMKTYTLHLGTPVNKVTLSSYPACISSTDDYIMTGNGFLAMSTLLWIPSEGELAQPPAKNDGLPSFLRSIMATRLAVAPRMWTKVYGFLAGIAGAKQWLLVDYAKLKDGQPLANDTVWMVESLARFQRGKDLTESLVTNGFVEAHGVPHFRDVRVVYGLPEEGPGAYEEHKQSALVDKGATISNLANARELLRESQPSRRNQLAITSRFDLDPDRPVPAGGIDAKVTNKCLVSKMGLQAKSGPAITEGGNVFSWLKEDGSEAFPGWAHAGLPSQFNFSWVNVLPGMIQSPIRPDMAECDPNDPSDEN